MTATYHDIERDGIHYIMQWTTDENGKNTISITEGLDPNDEETAMGEIYDFNEVIN